ncbi:hypothetical protein MCUN1_003901 [Malassezia cuniculi]|uniref:Rhodanese domain-containing protein n=1 Tax=Malassezia cuniculi TaxID=948313 RepID=A0AAF0EYX9_9BASI|nr:hypothetical protein MCUN1_003901 [Malassezia cuniculi]
MNLHRAANIPPLVLGPQAVAKLLRSEAPPRILDATWFLNAPGATPRNALDEFRRGPRVPTSSFWDVDQIATRGESVRNLPHMMPSAAQFAEAARKHGIARSSHVVVYDRLGVFSAPRTVFTFRAFGHPRVSLLDGGLPAWEEAGLPLETAPPSEPQPLDASAYPTPELSSAWIRSFDEMLANIGAGMRRQTVLDARPAARFAGTAPEPRPGVASGHIPGSVSLPFPAVLAERGGTAGAKYTVMREQHELWQIIDRALADAGGIDKLRHDASAKDAVGVSLTCGSGMTAAVLWLALQQLGIDGGIYDESWMGWGARAANGEAPVAKSAE